MFVDIIILFIL